MFGFSVFLGNEMTNDKIDYIKRMKRHGFKGIFTSMHIPEDDSSSYLEKITILGNVAKEQKLKLMVDISTAGLSALGLDIEKDLDTMKTLGITGLRVDYGLSMEWVAKASNCIEIGLNASTLSEKEIAELKKYHANFSSIELWHNYYPRSETGLCKHDFILKNKWLHQLGAKIVAFTPGDDILRGPLYNHLPTLEKHRASHPLAGAIELLNECYVDEVYIGDERICNETLEQFHAYIVNDIILLPSVLYTQNYDYLLLDTHTNRMDTARDVVRSQEARFKKIPFIPQFNTTERKTGAITLDNHLYGRYAGELQIVKFDLQGDTRVNVMGAITDTNLDLINWVGAGQKYKLVLKG